MPELVVSVQNVAILGNARDNMFATNEHVIGSLISTNQHIASTFERKYHLSMVT